MKDSTEFSGHSILFVCMGNICRSPAAECVFKHQLAQAGKADRVRCDSAGTLGYHSGEPPDSRMQAALRRRGVPIVGTARKVTAADLHEFSLVLAMDRQNLEYLLDLQKKHGGRAKIALLGDYLTSTPGAEVPDPYYGGTSGFELVLDMLEEGCSRIVSSL